MEHQTGTNKQIFLSRNFSNPRIPRIIQVVVGVSGLRYQPQSPAVSGKWTGRRSVTGYLWLWGRGACSGRSRGAEVGECSSAKLLFRCPTTSRPGDLQLRSLPHDGRRTRMGKRRGGGGSEVAGSSSKTPSPNRLF